MNDHGMNTAPQLIICGHGSVDDPDGSIVYYDLLNSVDSVEYNHIHNDIFIVHLPPIDQVLNALLSKAKVALLLSHHEGKLLN